MVKIRTILLFGEKNNRIDNIDNKIKGLKELKKSILSNPDLLTKIKPKKKEKHGDEFSRSWAYEVDQNNKLKKD